MRQIELSMLRDVRNHIDTMIAKTESSKVNLNPFEVLGVSPNATQEEILAAYRTKAAQTHPDKPGGTNEAFIKIQAAYEAIERYMKGRNLWK